MKTHTGIGTIGFSIRATKGAMPEGKTNPRAGRLGRSALLVAVAAVVLCGCTRVGPEYIRPETSLSPEWLEAHDSRVKTDPAEYRAWWEVFDDPNLDTVIDRAYRENLSLKIAGVRVLEARAQLGIAVGGLYPQSQFADGHLTFTRSSGRSSAAGRQPGIDLSIWEDRIGLGAGWEIDFWGKFRRSVEAADADLRGAVADYDHALVTLTADAATLYVQIRTTGRRLEIARQNVETQKESLRIAEARFQGGTTTQRDVEQAKTVLYNTEATIPILEAQFRQAENALGVLLGLPPGNLEGYIQGPAMIPAPPPQVAVGIPADLLRRRPDVRGAELQAMAQSARIGVARADLFPAFSLSGTFGFAASDVGRFELSDLSSREARTGSFGPSVRWDILNYGRITNNVRVQDARLQELLLAYQNAVLRAQQEMEDSLAGYLRAQENAEFLALSAEAARRSLDLAFVQYQQGITDFTTVLTAQQALLSVQDNLASALGSISANLVALYRALGGGWKIREGKELVPPEVKEVMARRTNWGKLLDPAVTPEAGPASAAPVQLPDW
jgi:NodT family efflux transporter outer membrane factor (OMF) lipoprotein